LLISLFSQLISALKYCYDQKIIHGDIKSENILITDSNIVKLADFGISQILPNQDSECNPASTPGSLEYTSPGKLQGDFFSYSSDVWSLGVVFYELMELELPFKAENSIEIFSKIKKADFSPSQNNIQMN
jgi:serine/threonine-protein kinase